MIKVTFHKRIEENTSYKIKVECVVYTASIFSRLSLSVFINSDTTNLEFEDKKSIFFIRYLFHALIQIQRQNNYCF